MSKLFAFFRCVTFFGVSDNSFCSIVQHCFDVAHGYRQFIHLLIHTPEFVLPYILRRILFACWCVRGFARVCACAVLVWHFPSDYFYHHFAWCFRTKIEHSQIKPKIKADLKYNTQLFTSWLDIVHNRKCYMATSNVRCVQRQSPLSNFFSENV